MTTVDSDAALLDRWLRGDGSAFAALVRAHERSLLRYAAGLLGPGSAHEDVVQEAFLRLARSPPELPEPEAGRAQLSPWLHRVVRNLCMDLLRSEGRRRRRERDVAPPEATAGGQTSIDASDTRAAVERSLERLPDDQREVLVLRLLGEKSYREIAEITGRRTGTVGWLISVGLKALAAELAPLFGNPESGGSAAGGDVPGLGLDMARGELG